MQQGDKVLAEQILELRYYFKKDSWTKEKYYGFFNNPEIIAWAGRVYPDSSTETSPNKIKWLIDGFRTWMDEFEKFSEQQKKVTLTAGTPANNYVGEYPTLVGQLNDIPFKPIIRTKFDTMETVIGAGTGDNLITKKEYVFETTKLEHSEVLIYGDTFFYESEIYAVNLSDPELASYQIPNEIFNNDSIFEVKAKMTDENYNTFYESLSCKLNFLKDYATEKFIRSEIGASKHTESMFYMGVPTFWGHNDVFVFEKSDSGWEYDRFQFKKQLVTGMVAQTGFRVNGTGTVHSLPDYGSNFNTAANNNS